MCNGRRDKMEGEWFQTDLRRRMMSPTLYSDSISILFFFGEKQKLRVIAEAFELLAMASTNAQLSLPMLIKHF